MLTASEVDKGKKNLDTVKAIAPIIDELQHVAVSFQQSRASLPSMLPPEILKEGRTQSSLFKTRKCKSFTGQKQDWEFASSHPCLLHPELKGKKKEAETELLSGTPQKTFQAQGQPRDQLEKSKTCNGKAQVILSFAV